MNYAIDLNKYYIHIVAIPTNKGANSYKLIISKIWEQKFLRFICFYTQPGPYSSMTLV